MGLDANGVKFLLYAARRGVDFGRTATIGRQSVLASPKSIEAALRARGKSVDADALRNVVASSGGYCESLLHFLGAESVTSFDASSYENASEIHDFNHPIDDKFKNRFTAVLDGGTLEHIFNFPTALKNCMEMVVEGGHFLSITPTNNFLGHGFYQFSPELHYGVFNEANGFEIVDLIFFEDFEGAPWYRVCDPKAARGRVTLENARPAYLLVIAKRSEIKPIFTQYPQQSDYSLAWNGEGPQPVPRRPSLIARAPGAVLRRVRRWVAGAGMRFDPNHFIRFDPFE
jgi:hypothetical protein